MTEHEKHNPESETERDGDEREAVSARPLAPPAHAHAHAHAGAAHVHDDHGIAHVTPVRLLLAVFGALIVLTIATVAVRGIDLGGQLNLILAMVIATIKAGLVVTYFMHLRWDRTFNVLIFLSSLLFLILFLTVVLTDRREYQPDIDLVEQSNTEQTGQP